MQSKIGRREKRWTSAWGKDETQYSSRNKVGMSAALTDPSVEGVRQAQAIARKLKLHVNASVAREEDFDLGREKWDLIVITYVRRLNCEDANRFQQALKPGGILVYENNNVGGRNELLRAFLGYRILRFEDVDAHTDWHPEKKQQVERLICERP
jgi:hypothetical protein